MTIRYARPDDLPQLVKLDKHISPEELSNVIFAQRLLVGENGEKLQAWLRFNLFWDNTPFLTMLCVLKDFRHSGLGSQLLLFWENEMKNQGYNLVLTSSQSDEQAQEFYRRHGYNDAGCLILKTQATELLFTRNYDY